MAAQDKVIASILVLHSMLGAVWTYWMASRFGFPVLFLIFNIALVLVGLAAGIGWFRERRWAAWLGSLFFAMQLIHIATTNFHFSFTLGFSMIVAMGWFGVARVGINLFALVMLFWLGVRVAVSGSPFKRSSALPDASGS
ncbi:hypothetical protein GCM10027285_14490 [Oleiagrimonas citrea]|jgi:hypothetical protein|uniref:Uncharacterized protein n=1 Tax=Oleiagrimonas citrea TaxID=1665687 RepID=A0A846ZPA8_9GAMM|nr:hypothetical protein [Oleiagrimonas citrea]NKZ40054.1 hypothetical protein [Oleiagrimonas citrea]